MGEIIYLEYRHFNYWEEIFVRLQMLDVFAQEAKFSLVQLLRCQMEFLATKGNHVSTLLTLLEIP